MKYLARLLAVFSLAVACVFAWGGDLAAMAAPSPIVAAAEGELVNPADAKRVEIGYKIDINNTNIRQFRQFRGLYPTLAAKIVNNAPYEKVEDLLDLPDLTDSQKERLEANFENFIVTPQEAFLNEGDERFNNGIY
ncbi:MAG: photosystem II complex extrinsic protein PsbU [Oscillatoriales cyanobacterium]|jgi:photosystem II PsbU protein|nr:MAG: photosystem II complex extrinsic protein PsbU [Oscillatoriales cyanobacterium]